MGITFTWSPNQHLMTLRYWCFIGCLVHVSQHGQEIFVILGLHSWHCLLRWWHHWLGCWHYHSFVSWIKKSRPFNISKLQGKCCRKKTTLPWSCFRWKFLWRLRFMFVVELLAGWVVFLQFFETWRRWCLLENRHCLKQVAMVKLLWGMDIFAMREPFLCLRSATQEVFDQSENFWICIFWDVVFHLHHGLTDFRYQISSVWMILIWFSKFFWERASSKQLFFGRFSPSLQCGWVQRSLGACVYTVLNCIRAIFF